MNFFVVNCEQINKQLKNKCSLSCKLVLKRNFFHEDVTVFLATGGSILTSSLDWTVYAYVCQELKIESKFARSQCWRNQQSIWPAIDLHLANWLSKEAIFFQI